MAWTPTIIRGSDIRTTPIIPVFEMESWWTAVGFWLPIATVSWLVTLLLTLIATPVRLAATLAIRVLRIVWKPAECTGRGDFSEAVTRARCGAASSDGELPRATASWLLDPRSEICKPNPVLSHESLPASIPEPSLETISIREIRTEVLVLPASGMPAGASADDPSNRRGKAAAIAKSAGELGPEPNGASPGVGRGAIVMVLFPGNPGGVGFYTDFIQHLSAVSAGMMTIVCVGFAGHAAETASDRSALFGQPGVASGTQPTARAPSAGASHAPGMSPSKRIAGAFEPDPMASGWWPGAGGTPAAAPDLVDQIEHKVAFLADLRASDPTMRFVLAGHSIGAWMAKETAASLPPEAVAGVVGLFPTLEMLGVTRRGRALFPLMRLLTPSIVRLVDALSLIPAPLLSLAARLLLGPTCSENTFRYAPSLVSGPVVRNAVVLGYHEMKEVGPMVGPAADALLALKDRVLMYYGQDDHWNAQGEAEDMAARLPNAAIITDPHGHPHSFCLHQDACADVAAGVWGYLRSILIRSGVRPRKREAPAGSAAIARPAPSAARLTPSNTSPGSASRRFSGRKSARGSGKARGRGSVGRSAAAFDDNSADDDEGDDDLRSRGSSDVRRRSVGSSGRWRGAAERVLARSGRPMEPSPVAQFPAGMSNPAVRSAARAFMAPSPAMRYQQVPPAAQAYAAQPYTAQQPYARGRMPAPAPMRREASVESTGADSTMDFGAADAVQREASLQSVGAMLDRAVGPGRSLSAGRL